MSKTSRTVEIIFTDNCESPVSWGCKIYRLHFCSGVRPNTNECPGYGTKPPNCEAPALESWRMWSTPSLPLFPGPLRVVAPDRFLSFMGQNF